MNMRVLLFLLAFFPLGLAAQTEEWDSALGRYESITIECIRLKQELAAGGNVSASELQKLVGELNGLKTQLQGASGKMTAAQRARLSEIRKMYAEGVPRSTVPVKIKSVKASPGLFPAPPACPVVRGTRLASPLFRSPSARMSGTVNDDTRPRRYFAMLSAGIAPDLSYGLGAGILWKRWGVYVSARSNFVSPEHAFECMSDGSVADGSIIWTTGESRVSRLNLTAAALWHPTAWGSLYLGCGYGRRMLLWQDSGGEWAAVSDCSKAGIALDAGLILHYDRILFSLGASVIPGGSGIPRADLSAGLGWMF